ncbi:hypothetical protein BX600DRAFT_540180 [Xylariales sp. PMI_506]|nr:hypothetical protein BX600DRAFT_540180 [Xylariales sp. PMI_506]
MATAAACPVVGTTNDTLPPSHPDIDLSKPGQVCPVVGAKSDHHANLHQHPSVPLPKDHPDASKADAKLCPALNKAVTKPEVQAVDGDICPVVGTATTVLPPNHPSTANASEGDVCPVTKATVGHHKDKITEHPAVDPPHNAADDAVCPVTGQRGQRH